jgi:hypothetical protein
MCAKNTSSELSFYVKLFSNFQRPFFSFLSSYTGRDLPVNVAASFSVNLGGKPRKVSVEAVAGVENVGFKHAGQVIVFEVPSSYSSPI